MAAKQLRQDKNNEQNPFRHRRHPRHGRRGAHHARLHAAPGPRRGPGLAPGHAAAPSADWQGHAHLRLHARVFAGSWLCLRRRRRAAERAAAHARRGLPHAGAAAGPGCGHQRFAQRLHRQRREVLFSPRREAARRVGSRGRTRIAANAAVGRLGRPWQGTAPGRCRRPLCRVLQEHGAAQFFAARREDRHRRGTRRGLPRGARSLPRTRRLGGHHRMQPRRLEHQRRCWRHLAASAGAGGGRTPRRLRRGAGRRRRPPATRRCPGPPVQRR